jgi:hypothetical protein
MSWIRAGPDAPVSPNPPGTRVLVLWAVSPASLPDAFAAITLTPARARALLGLMDAMPPPAPATMRTDYGIGPAFRIQSRQLVDDRVVFYAGSRARVPGIAAAEARARAERAEAEAAEAAWDEDTCPVCGAPRQPAPTRAELETLMLAPLHFVDALAMVSPNAPYLLAVPKTWTAAGLRAVDRGARWIELDPTGVRWLQTPEEWCTATERAGSPFAAGRSERDAERLAPLWRMSREAAERERRARQAAEADDAADEDDEEASFGGGAFSAGGVGDPDAENGDDEVGEAERDDGDEAGEVTELATLLVPRALLDVIAAG